MFGAVPDAGGFAFCEPEDADAAVDVEEMVMVRPSLLKVAITGIAALTVTTAAPLLSL